MTRRGKAITEQTRGPEDSHLSVTNSSSTKEHRRIFSTDAGVTQQQHAEKESILKWSRYGTNTSW